MCLCASKVMCNYKLAISKPLQLTHIAQHSTALHSPGPIALCVLYVFSHFYGLLRCDCRTRCTRLPLPFSLFKLCDKNILITSNFVYTTSTKIPQKKNREKNRNRNKNRTTWVWHRSASNIRHNCTHDYTRIVCTVCTYSTKQYHVWIRLSHCQFSLASVCTVTLKSWKNFWELEFEIQFGCFDPESRSPHTTERAHKTHHRTIVPYP